MHHRMEFDLGSMGSDNFDISTIVYEIILRITRTRTTRITTRTRTTRITTSVLGIKQSTRW